MKRIALASLVLLVTIGVFIIATRGTPTIDVEPGPFPADKVYVVLEPGRNHVDLCLGGVFWFGMATSKPLGCSARTTDPKVTGIRMEVFRLDPGGPVLVARTGVISDMRAMHFDHDVVDDPIGTEFLLRGTFHYGDGTTRMEEKTLVVFDPAEFP